MFQVGYSSVKGRKEQNQDVVLKSVIDNDTLVVGVLDGHGSNGGQVAKFAHDELKLRIDKNFISQPDLKLQLIQLFQQVDKDLLTHSDVDTWCSGTTCSLVILQQNQLTVAHVGDCRVLLVSNDRCQQLTIEHTVASEQSRLEAAGAVVNRLMDEDQNYIGPLRIFKESMPYPGLALSRSFGDQVAKNLGVVCDPDVKQLEISRSEFKFLLVCCDGVTDAMSNDRCVKTLNEAQVLQNPQAASEALTRYSIERLDKLKIDDNSSNIVVVLEGSKE